MAQRIINPIFQAQNNSIASYDYADIAEGTGVLNFDLFTSKTDAGVDYHLGINGDLYSNEIETNIVCVDNEEYTKDGDVDFDLTILNLPKTVRGTAILNITALMNTSDAAGTGHIYLIAKVRKYSGTTETDIGTEQSETLDLAGAGAGSKVVKTICIPISLTQTHYQKGDILRLTIEVWTSAPTANWRAFISHDPQNRDGVQITPSSNTAITTKGNLFMPFRLDDLGY